MKKKFSSRNIFKTSSRRLWKWFFGTRWRHWMYTKIFFACCQWACCFYSFSTLQIFFRRRKTIKTFLPTDFSRELTFCLRSHRAFQGNVVWVTNNGKRVQLRDVFLPSLTEVERVVLEKQAQEKILQLGITLSPQGIFDFHFLKKTFLLISIIAEATSQSTQKPHKRRVLLLKRKAVTTGIFDSKGKDDYSNKGKIDLKIFIPSHRKLIKILQVARFSVYLSSSA